MSATPSTACDAGEPHNTSDVKIIMSSTFSTPSATFSSTQLHALRARVNGRVFVPGDDGYDTARQTWNATTFDQRPAIVVMFPPNVVTVFTQSSFCVISSSIVPEE